MPTHDITDVDQRIKTAAGKIAHRAAADTLALVDRAATDLAETLDARVPVTRAALLMLVVDWLGLELRSAGRDTIDTWLTERAAEGVSTRQASRELEEVMVMSRSGVGSAFGRRTDPPTPAAVAAAAAAAAE